MPRDLLLFPIAKDVRLVRSLAVAIMSERTDRGRAAIWRMHERKVERALQRLGITDGEIADQIRQFERAVLAEMLREAS